MALKPPPTELAEDKYQAVWTKLSPSSASWMGMWVIAVVAVAPCQCSWLGGRELTSPARILTICSPSHWVQHPAVVERDLGREVAHMIARKLVIYQRCGGGQSQFSTLLDLDAKSDRAQAALAFARENLVSDLSVEVLANAARLSLRQFSRVFKEETGQTPARAVERLRVKAARLMLETSRLPIEVVARESGFGDRERRRQSFLRAFGQSPQTIQRASPTSAILERNCVSQNNSAQVCLWPIAVAGESIKTGRLAPDRAVLTALVAPQTSRLGSADPDVFLWLEEIRSSLPSTA